MHHIQGLVAELNQAQAIAQERELLCVSLPQGFAYVVFDNQGVSEPIEDGPESAVERAAYLKETLPGVLGNQPVAYVETDYFGGSGIQSAALWRGGGLEFVASEYSSPWVAPVVRPINTALRMLGVVASPEQDEFDAIALGEFRSNNGLRAGRRPLGDDAVDARG